MPRKLFVSRWPSHGPSQRHPSRIARDRRRFLPLDCDGVDWKILVLWRSSRKGHSRFLLSSSSSCSLFFIDNVNVLPRHVTSNNLWLLQVTWVRMDPILAKTSSGFISCRWWTSRSGGPIPWAFSPRFGWRAKSRPHLTVLCTTVASQCPSKVAWIQREWNLISFSSRNNSLCDLYFLLPTDWLLKSNLRWEFNWAGISEALLPCPASSCWLLYRAVLAPSWRDGRSTQSGWNGRPTIETNSSCCTKAIVWTGGAPPNRLRWVQFRPTVGSKVLEFFFRSRWLKTPIGSRYWEAATRIGESYCRPWVSLGCRMKIWPSAGVNSRGASQSTRPLFNFPSNWVRNIGLSLYIYIPSLSRSGKSNRFFFFFFFSLCALGFADRTGQPVEWIMASGTSDLRQMSSLMGKRQLVSIFDSRTFF